MIAIVKDFLKLIRWFHLVLAILPFVGLYVVINDHIQKSGGGVAISGFDFILICVCVQLLIAAGCVLNDIMDRKIDKINKPKTHVVDRTISLRSAWIIFFILSALIFFFSVYIARNIFVEWGPISAAVYVLSILYDIYFKRTPLIGNILIAALGSFIPLVLFLFAKESIQQLHSERIVVLVWLFSLFPFFIIIPRELSLDISDIEGDGNCGCRTLPILIGIKRSKRVVAYFILLTIILSVIVCYIFPYLIPGFIVTDLMLVIYLFWLRKCEKRIDYIKAGRFIWMTMIVGLIGFIILTFI
jgi:4-hydroxybenzoate polyprenyltransferase